MDIQCKKKTRLARQFSRTAPLQSLAYSFDVLHRLFVGVNGGVAAHSFCCVFGKCEGGEGGGESGKSGKNTEETMEKFPEIRDGTRKGKHI